MPFDQLKRREFISLLAAWRQRGRVQKGYSFNDTLRRRSKLVVFFDLEGVEA